MYNRYVPQGEYERPAEPQSPPHMAGGQRTPFSFKDILSGGVPEGVRGLWSGKLEGDDPLGTLLKSLNVTGVDSGDILLVLLILFLLIEGDDHWELVITLGLLLIMGLADREESETQ